MQTYVVLSNNPRKPPIPASIAVPTIGTREPTVAPAAAPFAALPTVSL
ncbi:hypothetical protein QJU43_01375 [Pasteurella atlantica]|nr:hypothetical protein [Pasteurella atlantica]MDP8032941.1 hypothetical protein [Pasteurella atlantica]MDP8034902.1 hypothetical protein [Pasteurella atlantica]MDP8036828.1 hypothetical protein [Pasteurella atlantica]MDP8047199.1 hypothetical protein [Pasteurella atlantica]MDP8049291.1 hypothetical protein [Pasteurella atlantica]